MADFEAQMLSQPSENNKRANQYPTSNIFILDRTQSQIAVLSNDVPHALGYFNDIYVEALQSNLSTLTFEVRADHDTANLLMVEGYVIYTNPTNYKQQLFMIKEIEDIHEDTMIRRVFCELSAISELLNNIVRPVNMKSVTLEQALGIILNQTGYEFGEVEFSGLADINIEEHTTSLSALHRVAEIFGELEFEVIFSNNIIKKKLVNVYKKRGRETNKIFEYSRNLTSIKKTENSNNLVTALVGVGKKVNGVPLSFIDYPAPVDKDYPKVQDYIYSVGAFERFHKNGKNIFGIYFDDKATNAVELYENTKAKLKELEKPFLTYECKVVNFEQITGLDFHMVEVGDSILIKDFEFNNNNPLLLEGRVIEKRISLTDPSKSEIKLGEYKIAEYNTNQQMLIQQFQKVIVEQEEQFNTANARAEEAITKANESMEIAVVADGKADTAQNTANQALVEVAEKVNDATYQAEKNAMIATIGEKANLTYVDGALVDKANKGDVYTKVQVDETLLGYVSNLTYETDQNGVVQRLDLAESNITQNQTDIQSRVLKADYDLLENRVNFAESSITQNAENIELRVEKNGVISAINQTSETIEISANKINLDGAVTADSISSLNGLNIGNGQFVVDNIGNVTFAGTLNGASGTFSGDLIGGSVTSNTSIDVTTDLQVGKNIYLARPYENRFDEKTIFFNDESSYVSKIAGTYLKLEIICDNTIRLISNVLEISSASVRFNNNTAITFNGVQPQTSTTEKGWCGTGAYTDVATAGITLTGVGVNFKMTKTYTPSTVTLTKVSGNAPSVHAIDISSEGFWLYITKGSGASFWFWRGYYEC